MPNLSLKYGVRDIQRVNRINVGLSAMGLVPLCSPRSIQANGETYSGDSADRAQHIYLCLASNQMTTRDGQFTDLGQHCYKSAGYVRNPKRRPPLASGQTCEKRGGGQKSHDKENPEVHKQPQPRMELPGVDLESQPSHKSSRDRAIRWLNPTVSPLSTRKGKGRGQARESSKARG